MSTIDHPDPICGHCQQPVLNSQGRRNKDGTMCHISCHDGRLPYYPRTPLPVPKAQP